jgi:hypothetical protein
MSSQNLISLEIARAHLRVGDDHSLDTLIEEYLEMAIGYADDLTNRSLKEEFTAATLPPAIKSAILLTVGTLLDNESDALVGRSVSQLPLTAEKLLLPWRVHPYSLDETPQPQQPAGGPVIRNRAVAIDPEDNV